MGQMIGRAQFSATSEDYYSELVELALERKDPAPVFLDLARARTEAPVDAGARWWLSRYFAAVDGARKR